LCKNKSKTIEIFDTKKVTKKKCSYFKGLPLKLCFFYLTDVNAYFTIQKKETLIDFLKILLIFFVLDVVLNIFFNVVVVFLQEFLLFKLMLISFHFNNFFQFLRVGWCVGCWLR
jgi:hypothetical protein